VGAANLALAQRVLARFARVVVIGVGGGGGRVELDLLTFMGRRASLTGSTLRSRSREEKARVIARVGEEMVPLWTSGQLRMPIDHSFELAEVDEAYAWFAKPGKFGKVVLRVND
jgi:NADPH2:quinone reductase